MQVGLLAKILALVLNILAAGEARASERDSSGTTKPPSRTSGATAAKVMERIARREQKSTENLFFGAFFVKRLAL
jgi:hypothetical protein